MMEEKKAKHRVTEGAEKAEKEEKNPGRGIRTLQPFSDRISSRCLYVTGRLECDSLPRFGIDDL
jgi:hypothetical protein